MCLLGHISSGAAGTFSGKKIPFNYKKQLVFYTNRDRGYFFPFFPHMSENQCKNVPSLMTVGAKCSEQ